MRKIGLFMLLFAVAAVHSFSAVVCAEEAKLLSQGQTLYVPAYSHIYAGNRDLPLLLTVTLTASKG